MYSRVLETTVRVCWHAIESLPGFLNYFVNINVSQNKNYNTWSRKLLIVKSIAIFQLSLSVCHNLDQSFTKSHTCTWSKSTPVREMQQSIKSFLVSQLIIYTFKLFQRLSCSKCLFCNSRRFNVYFLWRRMLLFTPLLLYTTFFCLLIFYNPAVW